MSPSSRQLLPFHGMLLVIILPTPLIASYCGPAAIPFTFQALRSGQPVLGCAQPRCFGWTPNGTAVEAAQFYRIHGKEDGYMRKSDANPPQARPSSDSSVSVCSMSYGAASCGIGQWVGGIRPQPESSGSMELRCCSYGPLLQSEDRGIATVRPGQLVVGGEVTVDGRMVAFDYVADIARSSKPDGSVEYNVAIRRMSCIADGIGDQSSINTVSDGALQQSSDAALQQITSDSQLQQLQQPLQQLQQPFPTAVAPRASPIQLPSSSGGQGEYGPGIEPVSSGVPQQLANAFFAQHAASTPIRQPQQQQVQQQPQQQQQQQQVAPAVRSMELRPRNALPVQPIGSEPIQAAAAVQQQQQQQQTTATPTATQVFPGLPFGSLMPLAPLMATRAPQQLQQSAEYQQQQQQQIQPPFSPQQQYVQQQPGVQQYPQQTQQPTQFAQPQPFAGQQQGLQLQPFGQQQQYQQQIAQPQKQPSYPQGQQQLQQLPFAGQSQQQQQQPQYNQQQQPQQQQQQQLPQLPGVGQQFGLPGQQQGFGQLPPPVFPQLPKLEDIPKINIPSIEEVENSIPPVQRAILTSVARFFGVL